MINLFERILKFGAVGVIGMGIDFLITWLLKERFKVNKFYANACGFSVAVINNYLLNRAWTFNDREPGMLGQFILFLSVSLLGLVMNTGVLYLLNEKQRVPFYLSKILAIVVVFVWNFIANSFFTFHHA